MDIATLGLTEIDQQIADALGDGILLGGRIFRRQRAVTFERNVYTAKAAHDTGLSNALRGFDPAHETVGPDIELLILNAFANGSMYRVLAGVLGEDAIEWSVPIAAENARFFARLTDAADQARLYEISSWVLLDFFLNAGGSWRIFLKYLSQPRTDLPASNDSADAATAMQTPNDERAYQNPEAAAMPTWGNGTASSGLLPEREAAMSQPFSDRTSATG